MAIHSPNARQVPVNKLRGRAGTYLATLAPVMAWATGPALEAAASEIAAVALVLAVAQEEPIASAVGMFRVAAEGTGMRSEEVLRDTADRAHAPAAVVAHPVLDRAEAAAEDSAGVAAAAGEGRRDESRQQNQRNNDMRSSSANTGFSGRVCILCAVAWVCASSSALVAGQESAAKPAAAAPTTSPTGGRLFDTPQQAADALVEAAEAFDPAALTQIFGPDGDDVVFSGEFAQDRKHATDFAAKAREKKSVSVDPKRGSRAFLLVGNEDWPFPVPLVKRGEKWFFDSNAGRQELLYRRIGANELDAIEICRGYVEAQDEYATRQRQLYDVNQYAQRIISTPGKQDGLAWQNPDGTWGGPIGENIAKAIEQGYTSSAEPYHGYFFKILKGQGPAAPLGQMNYVVEGVMIGGFALVAAPAEYDVTGVRTFIVSNDGVVYEKDLGPTTLDEFKKMELFNPDKSWTPVPDSPE